MINIFGDGPYLVSVGELAFQAAGELIWYVLHVSPFALAAFLLKRRLRGTAEWAAALALALLQAAFVWISSIRSEWFFSFCLAALLTGELKILNLVPLRPLDQAFFFAALCIPARLFNSTSSVVGHLWIFWILFFVLYLTLRMEMGTLRGSHFLCYFLFVFLSLSMYLYELAVLVLHPRLGALFEHGAWGTVTAVTAVSACLIAAAFAVRSHFQPRLESWNSLGRKYGKIEHYFFFFSLFILISFTLIYLPFTAMRMQNALVALLIPALCLFFLAAQALFITLLLRVALYRDSDTFHRWERENMVSYYQNLQASVSAMEGLRHDIKNIFFTMGNFVDRNDDPEMKQFFWETIYPYSETAIRQSELQSRLWKIPSESLRAFLYLKTAQAAQQGVSVQLEVSLLPEEFQTGMDIIDLTRILGILLDNAMEETALIPGGVLSLKVAGSSEGCSYILKNPVTEERKRTGIRPGTTSKGAGRGHGLAIVQELLAQYPNAALNSVLRESAYIQSLNISFRP